MYDVFYLAYVHFFAIVLTTSASAIVALGAVRAGLTPVATARAVLGSAILLGAWFAIAMRLSETNHFNVPTTFGEPPLVLLVLLGGGFGLWALARYTSTGRAISDSVDPGLLVAFQIPRVMGALFLLGWALGEIPWQFALPAGIGDVWAGIAGYQAWKANRQKTPDARAKMVRANVIGITDFIVAVFTGIATSEGVLHLWAHEAPNIINLHPLAMFPGFFVPLFLAFHLVLISRLRQ